MILIISGTNRPGSNTLKVSKQYQHFMHEMGVESELLSLTDLHSLTRDEAFVKLEQQFLEPATKFVFVLPEYNGSFPGIFKLMIDLSDINKCWNHKKVLLVGVANGRSGNLRGLDTMTNMCNYMKMHVFHQKLPISSVNTEIPGDIFVHEHTIAEIKKQIEGFVKY